MDRPLVSVVIPTFNRPNYLKLALSSAVEQTYRNLEIIVHDNGSDADPSTIIEEFKDARIVLYRNPINMGQSYNIIEGCLKANGKYIAILGDDDLWYPDFLSTLTAPLELNPDTILAFCDHEVIDEQGNLKVRYTESLSVRWGRNRLEKGYHRPFFRIALVDRSICLVSGALLRREAIDWSALPRDLLNGLDVYINYLACRTGMGCYFCRRRLTKYRYHKNSAGNQIYNSPLDMEDSARAALQYWTLFANDIILREWQHYFKVRCTGNAMVVILSVLRQGRWWSALKELIHFYRNGV